MARLHLHSLMQWPLRRPQRDSDSATSLPVSAALCFHKGRIFNTLPHPSCFFLFPNHCHVGDSAVFSCELGVDIFLCWTVAATVSVHWSNCSLGARTSLGSFTNWRFIWVGHCPKDILSVQWKAGGFSLTTLLNVYSLFYNTGLCCDINFLLIFSTPNRTSSVSSCPLVALFHCRHAKEYLAITVPQIQYYALLNLALS